MFLDRRVDPDQRVELSIEDQPLETAINQIAGRTQLGVSRIGTTFYYGPATTTAYLGTIAALRRDDIQKLTGRALAIGFPACAAGNGTI